MSTAGILQAAANNILEGTGEANATPAFLDEPLIVYHEVPSTNAMAAVPRFGHTRNISRLFSNDAEEAAAAQQDYFEGLLFVGIFVMVVFIVWTVTIWVLALAKYCCRCDWPGFLTGRPFTFSHNDSDEPPTKQEKKQWKSKTRIVRFVFLMSGLVLIIFSILLVNRGFQQVEATRSTADNSLDDVRVLIDEASILAGDLRDVGTSAIDLRDKLVTELDMELCPGNPGFADQNDIGKSINENAKVAVDLLELLGEFATNDISSLEDGLSQADNTIDDIDVIVESVAEKEWAGVIFVVLLVVLASLMMVGTIAAQAHLMNDCYGCALSYFVLPVFFIMIIVSYVLCAVLALSASANADFCTGGTDRTPDSTIMLALKNTGVDQTSTEFEIARYYVSQCTRKAKVDPFLFLRQHEAEIIEALTVVQKLSNSISKVNLDTLSFNCERDFGPLVSSLDTMNAILDTLAVAAKQGLNLLKCERILPIYTDIVYEGTCNHSVTGLTWGFYSLLIISTMGMIMIMFRSSFLNNNDADFTDPTDDADSEFHDMSKMARAMQRGQQNALAEEAAMNVGHHHHHDHFNNIDEAHWDGMGIPERQDTSDTSVYTADNGELPVLEAKTEAGEMHIIQGDPAKMWHTDEDDHHRDHRHHDDYYRDHIPQKRSSSSNSLEMEYNMAKTNSSDDYQSYYNTRPPPISPSFDHEKDVVTHQY